MSNSGLENFLIKIIIIDLCGELKIFKNMGEASLKIIKLVEKSEGISCFCFGLLGFTIAIFNLYCVNVISNKIVKIIENLAEDKDKDKEKDKEKDKKENKETETKKNL